jgi:TolA-binding protein
MNRWIYCFLLSVVGMVCLPAAWCQTTRTVPAPAPDPTRELATLHALFNGKQFTVAAQGYILFLQNFPQHPDRDEVLYRLGECYRQLGQPGDAMGYFEQVLKEYEASPFAAFARVRKAESLLAANKPDQALPLLERSLDHSPIRGLRLNTLFLLVQTLQKLGRSAEAMAFLEQLAAEEKENPFRAYAILALGVRDEAQGKLAEALNAFRHALALADTAEMRGEAGVRAGMVALRLKEWKEAAALFETVRRLEVPDRWKRAAWMGLIRARFAGGEHAVAGGLVVEAGEMLPAEFRPEAWYYRASALRMEGKAGEARALYERVMKEDPRGHYGEAAAYERLLILVGSKEGGVAAAARDFLQQFPESAQAMSATFLLGDALSNESKFGEAIVPLEKVTAAGQPESVQADAWFKLGWARLASEQYLQAARAFRQLVDRYPKASTVPEALWQLGLSHERVGASAEAVRAWDQLLRDHAMAPQVEQALFRKGLSLGQSGNLPAARELFSQLLRRFPRGTFASDARYWRGRVAFEMKDYAEATSDLEMVRNAKPEFVVPATERLLFAAYRLDRYEAVAGFLADWNRILAKDPKAGEPASPALLLWLAQEYEKRLNWAKAQPLFESATDSRDAELRAVALLGSGRSLMQLKQYGLAVGALETLRREYPANRQDVEVSLLLGAGYVGVGQFVVAKELAEAVMVAAPEGIANARARMIFADALAGEGDMVSAVKHYSSVATLFDDPVVTPEALAKAADLYHRLNQPDEAEQVERDLATRYPKSIKKEGS